MFSDVARSGRNASGRAAASSRQMVDGFLDRGQRLLPPPQVGQPDRQVVQRPGEAVGGVRFSAEGVCPVLGDLLAGEGGGERGEPHAVLGHLAGERGGQVGLGRELQREAGQVGQFGVAGGDGQVDDAGQCRGEQLVQSRPDGGLVRGAAGQLGQQLGE